MPREPEGRKHLLGRRCGRLGLRGKVNLYRNGWKV
jgi:hypothetical protein